MRKFVFAALSLPLVLAACELTPRQQCEAPFRSELRVVLEDTKATRLTLSRGYRLVPARNTFGLHYCVNPVGHVSICQAEDGEPMFDKRPISRVAERAKLDALVAERQRLESALAQCAAQYPE